MKTPPSYIEEFAGDVVGLWSLHAAPRGKPSSSVDVRLVERKCQGLYP